MKINNDVSKIIINAAIPVLKFIYDDLPSELKSKLNKVVISEIPIILQEQVNKLKEKDLISAEDYEKIKKSLTKQNHCDTLSK
jgi:hypothetical protein